MTKEEKLEYMRGYLIDAIEYYRDEYHKKDSGHNEMIEKVKLSTSEDELDCYGHIVDMWLDGNW